MGTSEQGRTYGGMTAEDRRRQRHEALVNAGLELYGTLGYPNVSVKRVCDHAGLTQRYFYESFADRTALLAEVYRQCVGQARDAAVTAAAAVYADVGFAGGPTPHELIPRVTHDALGAMIHHLFDDPRRARILVIEVVGVSPEIEKLRLSAIHDWAGLILGIAFGDTPTTDRQRLAAIGLVGALTQLLVDWQNAVTAPISPELGPELFDVDAIHEAITGMFVATYEQFFADGQV